MKPWTVPSPTSFSSSFPTVILLSGFLSVFWFSTPFPLVTHLLLISPPFRSREDNVHMWLNVNTTVTWSTPWCIASLVPAKRAPQKDTGHPVLIQLSYSTITLDLLFFYHFSAQGQVSTYRSLWTFQSCECLRAQPGAGHLTSQQNRGKKRPRHFPPHFGAELLLCGRL